jgi:hypothetical protein
MHAILGRLEARLDDDSDSVDWVAVKRDVAAALDDEQTRVPMFCLMAKKILQRRVAGETDDVISKWLVERLGVKSDSTAQILSMTGDAGTGAADVADGADFDEVVDRIAGSPGAERPFVAAMVRMAIDLMKSEVARLDRRDFAASLMARMAVDEATIEGTMGIVRGLFARHAAGETDLGARLAEDTGMAEPTANSFIEQALLARRAAARLRRGEDVPTVFRELNLENAGPQFIILALRLADERDPTDESRGGNAT